MQCMQTTMMMKMSTIHVIIGVAIATSLNTCTTNAFLQSSAPSRRIVASSSSTRWTPSNTRKALLNHHQQQQYSSSSALHAYMDEDDEEEEEGYEINNTRTTQQQQQQTSTSFGAENVPVDQRPSNEYLNLINQPTYGWASQENGDGGLVVRLAVTYAAFFVLVCYPISGATWVNDGFIIQKLTASNVGAISVIFLLTLRLYSGWGYIGSRLQSKVIEFEETGWYDGDIEEKSEAEKARDLFLYRSNVQPVEERLKKFSLVIGGAWVASCLALNVATNMKPIFNQYDPAMLEKLSYDDKIADIVQQQSYGRPTYCENRYYRAVANGGQGC